MRRCRLQRRLRGQAENSCGALWLGAAFSGSSGNGRPKPAALQPAGAARPSAAAAGSHQHQRRQAAGSHPTDTSSLMSGCASHTPGSSGEGATGMIESRLEAARTMACGRYTSALALWLQRGAGRRSGQACRSRRGGGVPGAQPVPQAALQAWLGGRAERLRDGGLKLVGCRRAPTSHTCARAAAQAQPAPQPLSLPHTHTHTQPPALTCRWL